MTERFYSIEHLSTPQLRELYIAYSKHGWTDAEFHELMPEGVKPPTLTEREIILNIDADDEHNYCVLMIDCEDEEDGIMIGLGMSEYPYFAVYLHLPLTILDELVEKYGLIAQQEARNYTVSEHLIEKSKNDPLN